MAAMPFRLIRLPNDILLILHPKETDYWPLPERVFGNQAISAPLAQVASALQQFLPQRQFRGAPAGSGLPQTGLPAGGQKATALPGMQGSAAANQTCIDGDLEHTGNAPMSHKRMSRSLGEHLAASEASGSECHSVRLLGGRFSKANTIPITAPNHHIRQQSS